MKQYAIAFLGLGSIGKRHFQNVCAFLEQRGDTYSMDLYRSAGGRTLPESIAAKVDHQYLYADAIGKEKRYDVVFVTNPTSMHYEAVRKFSAHTGSFFIEKPVFDTTHVDESVFDLMKDIPAYVACPLRYSPVLLYMKENIPYREAFAVRAISSSYLPDWRPGQDYRKCYSAHREMGGGVGIDLIHEWDYLTHFFGMPEVYYNIQDKLSNLEIDSDDVAIYIAKNKRTILELHLDYFGRKPLRSLDLFMPEDTIHCDITEGKVTYLKAGETVALNPDRNSCQMAEIEHFFDIIEGKAVNDSDVRHACRVLKLAKGEI